CSSTTVPLRSSRPQHWHEVTSSVQPRTLKIAMCDHPPSCDSQESLLRPLAPTLRPGPSTGSRSYHRDPRPVRSVDRTRRRWLLSAPAAPFGVLRPPSSGCPPAAWLSTFRPFTYTIPS